MNEKLYTFTVPVIVHGTERIDVVAESEEEAREKLLEGDWYDSQLDQDEADYKYSEGTLDEVEELDNE